MFSCERCEDVDVIRWAVDDDRLAIVRSDDAAEIWKQTRFQIRVEQWPPVFRAKNDVRQQMDERVRHKISRIEVVVSAAEWRETVAHGANRGKEWQKDSSPGRGGRNGILNGDFLSPLPGLGKSAGD